MKPIDKLGDICIIDIVNKLEIFERIYMENAVGLESTPSNEVSSEELSRLLCEGKNGLVENAVERGDYTLEVLRGGYEKALEVRDVPENLRVSIRQYLSGILEVAESPQDHAPLHSAETFNEAKREYFINYPAGSDREASAQAYGVLYARRALAISH
jgi:hypothetical protein